jgi:uncharacterized protein (DUF1697 family)
MNTFICLLRGINVSGHKLIKMKELQRMFESLGYLDVKTFIQSGNIVFKTKQIDIQILTNQIHKQILVTFGFDVHVTIISSAELERIYKTNPFSINETFEIEKMLLTLLSGVPEKDKIDSLNMGNFGNDKHIIQGKELYLYCTDGYGKTKLSNNFIESKLKVSATTRNWKTVTELLKMTILQN